MNLCHVSLLWSSQTSSSSVYKVIVLKSRTCRGIYTSDYINRAAHHHFQEQGVGQLKKENMTSVGDLSRSYSLAQASVPCKATFLQPCFCDLPNEMENEML
mmetsp:Transcript_19785/g.38769  ORF Transcript_19785/g.38769 Transcript_19785/m.38769 type:complete len:101 (-) Transcript_19785:111-413(-)